MPEDCKNCIQVINIQKDIGELKATVKESVNRITDLERKSDANDEKFTTLFSKIDELKESVKEVAKKLDALASRPGQRWDEFIKTVIAVVTTAAVTYFITH